MGHQFKRDAAYSSHNEGLCARCAQAESASIHTRENAESAIGADLVRDADGLNAAFVAKMAEIKARRAARGEADPLARLRHHVTGAIERGEGVAIKRN